MIQVDYKKMSKMTKKEKKQMLKSFGDHISHGQIRYLRSGYLDMLENNRKGIRFHESESGEPIIDAFSSAGCFNVGRGNTEIIDTLDAALDDYDMGSFNMLSQAKIEFAKKLVSLTPGDLNKVILTGSGADAVEGAIKLARGATGRNRIISMINAYHGHSGFSLSAGGKDYYKKLFEPLMPGFEFAPFGDLDAVTELASSDTAAIILEPVQGEGGIHVAEDNYLKGLRKLCDDRGIMLIFDEIQTGIGRTGRLWCCEHSGVIPDIMVVAKSISGGLYPNGAIVYRDIDILTDFVDKYPSFHTSSGGGSDLGCIVSSKVLDYIVDNKVWENADAMGKRFKYGLLELANSNRKIIKEVRGKGLMIGIEYKYEFIGGLMAQSLAKQGIWAAYSGNAPQVMRFQIPITATSEDIDEILNKIRNAIKSMKKDLILMLPLARIPLFRRIFDNVKVQILTFNLIRDITG